MEIHIQPLTTRDIVPAATLHRKMITSWGSALGLLYLVPLYEKIVTNPSKGFGFVAYTVKQQVVGLVVCTNDTNWYSQSNQTITNPRLFWRLIQVVFQGSFSIFSAFGHIKTQKMLDLQYRKPYVSIQAICTDTAYQGQGIGRKLLEAVVDYCRKNTVHTIYVDTLISNVSAQRFYRAAGFSVQEKIGDSVLFTMNIYSPSAHYPRNFRVAKYQSDPV